MKKKKKFEKKDVAWWVYLVLLVLLTVFGLWNSEGAGSLIRIIGEAFSILIE